MESAKGLLAELNRLDVHLSIDHAKLRCNAPKGVITPELRTDIQRFKTELIKLLENQQRESADVATRNAITRIPREGELPLSYSQERIWLLSKLDPAHHVTGNVHFAFHIIGPLDIPILEQALNAIIQRHEVFRIRCATRDERPTQSIVSSIKLKLTVDHLTTLAADEKTAIIHQIRLHHALAPFDLATAPLLRARVLKIADQAYYFLLTTHLYIFDGWSTAILLRELSHLYRALQVGEKPSLPPLNAQYADFAHWHRQWFEGTEADRQHRWWIERLRHTQLMVNQPLKHATRPSIPGDSDVIEFVLPDFLADAVRNLSQQSGVTLFIGLLAAFQALLYTYTGQTKLATGSIVSNRRSTETENMIGSFANNILIPSDFSSGVTFQNLLEQVGKTSREAYANQDLPFERLLGELNPNLTTNPLFRTMFVLHQHQSQSGSASKLKLTGLQVEKLSDIKTLSKYDLELVMVERDDKLSGMFIHQTRVFTQDTIQALKNHFLQILKQVTDNPKLLLTDLPTLNPTLRRPSNHPVANQAAYEAPRNANETAIAEIWRNIFNFERIGIHDRFRDLGGHSLLAIQLINKLEQRLNLKMRLTDLDHFPTIAELAASPDWRREG